MGMPIHQFVDRKTGDIRRERLAADRLVHFVYSGIRENMPAVFRAFTSARGSRVLGVLNYDTVLGSRFTSARDRIRSWGVDETECLDDPDTLDTPRKLFCRRIRYWDRRPMPKDERTVVSPSDAKALVGSFRETSALFVKGKFFDLAELLSEDRPQWRPVFEGGDWALFRLTPDLYHYNHAPAAGRVLDVYGLAGGFHSCNPGAVVELVTPYSKNRRVVTIIDTDTEHGTNVGRVAMIEVAALMVGGIESRYSPAAYDDPQPVRPEMFLEKGQPVSLFQPGASTVVLLFEPGRIEFDADLVRNQTRAGAVSRFSMGFGRPLVETLVDVRSGIGRALDR
jgi:phosphatidylserine decarboxylase